MRVHVSKDQENCDLGLSQLCFSYITSIHETTGLTRFEVMFVQDHVIPIYLIYPKRLEYTREKILEDRTVLLSELNQTIISECEKVEGIEILIIV